MACRPSTSSRVNIEPSCQASANASSAYKQDVESCRRSEHAARDLLVEQWASFPADDRGSCHRLTTTGTPGTYTSCSPALK
jgi:hypothetical protein